VIKVANIISLSGQELEKIEKEYRDLLLQLYEKHIREIRGNDSKNEV
tara:strand:- start:2408 stop:2548 length:141 start_codon:yes stop_codon:yes gene_type:complete